MMDKQILISSGHDGVAVAVVENGKLVEYYVERPGRERTAGSIYKGRVENVLPGMRAAFVNIGLERNAFLYVDDAFPRIADDDEDDVGEIPRNARITDILKPGQEIMVQVAKEPLGTKGARVTRNITLPGKYLVLMPGVDYVGVSRRIQDEAERARLRELAERLKLRGGAIVRTAAEGKSEEDLARDARFLQALWSKIERKYKTARAPDLLHRDFGLVYRIVRDSFDEEVSRVYVDDRHVRDRIIDLLDDMAPELKDRVHLFKDPSGDIFDAFGLRREIDQATDRRVWLKSGGYIVIDTTEALTVVDVNSGKYVGTVDLADTAFKTNLEAAAEIARQLRLRDIGGIIVIDFIDMEKPHHRQEVIRTLEQHLKHDRTKAYVLGITSLGLVEMTRKRVRQGLEATLLRPCPYCEGRGKVLSEESMAQRVRNQIRSILRHTNSEAILVEVHPSVASLLIGPGGANLKELETQTGKSVFIRGSDRMHLEGMDVKAIGPKEEVERRAMPVREGEVLELKVEEPHASNPWDGIARISGYVVDIEGAGGLVGRQVKVEIVKAFRTYARARLLSEPSS